MELIFSILSSVVVFLNTFSAIGKSICRSAQGQMNKIENKCTKTHQLKLAWLDPHNIFFLELLNLCFEKC
jgi:hypothetical protein